MPCLYSAQEFITFLGKDETVGPFIEAIDPSIQIRVQTEFLEFIILEDCPRPKDIETEFGKLGFDFSDFDVILKIFRKVCENMPAGEPERCLASIKKHKAVFLGENLDKSFGLSIIGGVKKLDLIAANCVAEARQFQEFAAIFNIDVNHEHFLVKFLAYALEVPKLTPKMKESLLSLKACLGFNDKHTTGLLRILHDVLKRLNIDPHYAGLMEGRIFTFKREISDFETFIIEEITVSEDVAYRDKYLIESIGGESVMPEIVSSFYKFLREDPKIGYLYYTEYEKSQAQAQSNFLLAALSSTPLTPFVKYGMEYFHSRYPLSVGDYGKVQEAYVLAFKRQKIQEVLIDMCMDKIDLHKNFYTTESLVKTSARSIYKEIGGYNTVKKVAALFLANLDSDDEMGSYFCTVSHPLLKNYLTQFLCVLLDNDSLSAAAKDRLRSTHHSMNIQDKAFNKTKEAMRTSLTELGVNSEITAKIMEKMESTRLEITYRGDLGDFSRELSDHDSLKKRSSDRSSVTGRSSVEKSEHRSSKSGGFMALLRKTPSFNNKKPTENAVHTSSKQSEISDQSKLSNNKSPSTETARASSTVADKRRSRRASVTESFLGIVRKISNVSNETSPTSKASDISDGSKKEITPPQSNLVLSNSNQNVPNVFRKTSSNTTSKRPSKQRSSSVSQNRPDIKNTIAEDFFSSFKSNLVDDDDKSVSGKSSDKQKSIGKEEVPPLPKRSVYEAIGGEVTIFEMVEQWGELVKADTFIAPFFAKSNMIKIKATQKRILTMLLTLDSIPEKDSKLIAAAHSNLHLTNNHFDRMLGTSHI